MLSGLIRLGFVMISQHNLRFVTKVLVAAISLVGISAAYLYITNTSENLQVGVQAQAVDNTPTASISHFPEERLAVEEAVSRKPIKSIVRRIENRSANKNSDAKVVMLRGSASIGKTTQTKTSVLPKNEMIKGVEAKKGKTIAQSNKKAPGKNDPIAALLVKH
jgi:hypothetical protein